MNLRCFFCLRQESKRETRKNARQGPAEAARGGAPEPAAPRIVLEAGEREQVARKAARTESASQASGLGAPPGLMGPAGGASEPAGGSAGRPIHELTAAADQAAENLARMLDEHLMLPERREAPDGRLYTEEEFRELYGEGSASRWEAAERVQEYKWTGGDLHSVVGRALWPRNTPKRAMLAADGEVQLAAAMCQPKDLVQDLFKTLLRVRQAQFGVWGRGDFFA